MQANKTKEMKTYEKYFHKATLSLLFSILCWLLIKNLIIDIGFFRYFLIELLLILSMRLLKFTLTKLKLDE
jgi:hypothetical protein